MSKRTTIHTVLEAVHLLASHMDERFDQAERKMDEKLAKKVDRTEFEQKTNEIITHIDQFVTLHQKVDLETVALRSRCERIEAKLNKHGIN